MNYALFFKNHSFYNELYTARLGAILRPFWHRAGPVAEQSRAEPSRAGPSRAEPSRAGPSRAGPSRAESRPTQQAGHIFIMALVARGGLTKKTKFHQRDPN